MRKIYKKYLPQYEEGINYYYSIDDNEPLKINKFECEYRATRREEINTLFIKSGCKNVLWLFPEETEFYQPIVVVRK